MGVAAAGGGAGSGVMMTAGGYQLLAAAAAGVAILIVPIALGGIRWRPSPPTPKERQPDLIRRSGCQLVENPSSAPSQIRPAWQQARLRELWRSPP